VRRKKAPRGQQWSAAVTHAAAARRMVGKLLDGVFDGSASRLVAHLVEGGKLSDSERAELRRLIDVNSDKTARKGAKMQRTQK
jgi:predicted transcriptional regulator